MVWLTAGMYTVSLYTRGTTRPFKTVSTRDKNFQGAVETLAAAEQMSYGKAKVKGWFKSYFYLISDGTATLTDSVTWLNS